MLRSKRDTAGLPFRTGVLDGALSIKGPMRCLRGPGPFSTSWGLLLAPLNYLGCRQGLGNRCFHEPRLTFSKGFGLRVGTPNLGSSC